jgi:putative lipoic acid-binding regulatory protein
MITFPCHFPIKIIFNNVPGAEEALLAIVRDHYPDLTDSAIKLKPSENGQYVSLTVTVVAQDQASLDMLYRQLTQHPHIKMVL